MRAGPPTLADLDREVGKVSRKVRKVAIRVDAIDEVLDSVDHAALNLGSGLEEFLKSGGRPLRFTSHSECGDCSDAGVLDLQIHLVAGRRVLLEFLAAFQSIPNQPHRLP